jgi:glycine dehydrogenase subunit 2
VAEPLPSELLRSEPAGLPEISELDLVRHFTNLSRRNFSVDTHFYPLGSCTMKYNPRVLEDAALLFEPFHPMTALLPGGEAFCQGSLGLLYDLGQLLADITGMDEVCCQPLAGAQGELAGIMLIAAWHRARGSRKRYVLVPDSSHGTNPASAAMAGFEIITVASGPQGDMDMELFRQAMNDQVAAVMMTCPNTLGLFNPRIGEICDIAHRHDALMYYDGANLNAILGRVRPGDIGFDVVHLNLHKTFATPHGGGGPGAGPLGVRRELIPHLPLPRIRMDDHGRLYLETESELSIGRCANFFGNFGVLVRAYAYITMLGREGLLRVSEGAVLNANYIRERLKAHYDLPFDLPCMHECVFSASRQLANGIHAIDIAKYLIDRGFHPPTVYFPLNVREAIMIEPTESECRATLDAFVDAMADAARLAGENPRALLDAPLTMPVSRLDETRAAREMKLSW